MIFHQQQRRLPDLLDLPDAINVHDGRCQIRRGPIPGKPPTKDEPVTKKHAKNIGPQRSVFGGKTLNNSYISMTMQVFDGKMGMLSMKL